MLKIWVTDFILSSSNRNAIQVNSLLVNSILVRSNAYKCASSPSLSSLFSPLPLSSITPYYLVGFCLNVECNYCNLYCCAPQHDKTSEIIPTHDMNAKNNLHSHYMQMNMLFKRCTRSWLPHLLYLFCLHYYISRLLVYMLKKWHFTGKQR